MLHSTYLMSRGYTRVGDFIDKDGRIIYQSNIFVHALNLGHLLNFSNFLRT